MIFPSLEMLLINLRKSTFDVLSHIKEEQEQTKGQERIFAEHLRGAHINLK